MRRRFLVGVTLIAMVEVVGDIPHRFSPTNAFALVTTELTPAELAAYAHDNGCVAPSDDAADSGPMPARTIKDAYPNFLGVAVDPENGDIYIADGETAQGNFRVAVMDRTGKFLRQWQLNRGDADKDIRPVPHCIGLSNDGLVYVCDRSADQVQVFDKMGNFRKKIAIPWKRYNATRTGGGGGSAVALDFSPDPQQKYLFVVNQPNEKIDILERQTGKVLASIGSGVGHFAGQFDHAHGMAVDSKGNVYVAEVDGRRVQRFKIVRQ